MNASANALARTRG